tara:strand:- start:278 stop:1813 length:1536 start_codon:yes stop_codon:yes gene_type:complete
MKAKNYGKLNIPDFIWWLGVVEDNNDIAMAGRVKVRITGYHTANRETLPVKHLPYAIPINSVTSAAMNGIMENHQLVQGSTVIGFFADGDEGQIPMILGTVAGNPMSHVEDGQPTGTTNPDNLRRGFTDPTGKFPRASDGKIKGTVEGEGHEEGFAGVGEPDTSRLARNEHAEEHYSLINRREIREEKIRTATAPSVEGDGLLDDKGGKAYEPVEWDEPHPRGKSKDEAKYFNPRQDMIDGGDGDPSKKGSMEDYTSLYPFNTVKETRAGFVFETDNTEGNKRYHEYHPSGTHKEIHHDGTKVEKIIGDDYEIITKDKNVLIRGNCNVTIVGDCKMLVQGDKYEEIEGDLFQTIHGDRITKIQGSDIKSVVTDQGTSIKGNRTTRVALDDNQTIVGNQTEQVAKKKRETVVESVTESFGKHTTTVDKSTFRQSVGNIVEVTGGDLMFGAAGKSEFGSAGDQKFKTEANQTIEVATNQTKTVGGNESNTVSGNQTDSISGNLDIDASQIDLN